MKSTTFTTVQYGIINEIGTTLSEMGAPSGLMAIIMSLGDTQTDEDTLQMLQQWNERKYVKSKCTFNFNDV